MIRTSAAYRNDLAYIHHHGFSEFAESAAPGVIAILSGAVGFSPPTHSGHSSQVPRRAEALRSTQIVEIGCGSGVLARELTRAGYEVRGFDASPAMIDLARETAPHARFDVARFDSMDVPPCDAIVAMGEVLNYGTFDGVRTFAARAASALRKGGVLLFDVAEHGAYPQHDEHRVGGEDWSVIIIRESDGTRLTRRVLSFRKTGDEVRRDEEVHTLELYERAQVVSLLRTLGFRVDIRRSYRTRRLPAGHAVYIAVLP